MDIDRILNEWKVDGELRPDNLDRSSLDIPVLHGKYLKYLTDYKKIHRRKRSELKRMEVLKYDFYSGRMSMDQLKELGWKPFPHKVLKNDIERYVNGDNDILELRDKVTELSENINTVESIIDNINRRTFIIKSALDFMKFSNGLI